MYTRLAVCPKPYALHSWLDVGLGRPSSTCQKSIKKPKILSTFLQQSWFPVLESTTAVVAYTNNPLKLLVQIRNRIGMQKVHIFVLEDASWLLYAMTQFHISPADMEGMLGKRKVIES
jgi:hypothetical protein